MQTKRVSIPTLPYAITFRAADSVLPEGIDTRRTFDAPHIAPMQHYRMIDRMHTDRFPDEVAGE